MQKINHQKTVLKTNLFEVKKVTLSMPDDGERNYDLIEIQNAVTILPIDEDGFVYFVSQFRVGAGKELLELPAGKIEDGEDPTESAERELREETGMAAREMLPLGGFYMTPGYATEYMYCVLARGLYPSPLTPDADEHIQVTRVPYPSVLEMASRNQINDSKSLAALMLAANHLSNFA